MELTQEKIGLNRVTPSMLDKYEQCPKWFYYEDWLGIKLEEDKLHLDFGNAIHSAIEHIYLKYDYNFGGGWSNGSFELVEEAFLNHWRPSMVSKETFQNYMKTSAGRDSGFKEEKDLYEFMKKDGIAMLESYWDNKERLLVEFDYDLSEFEIPVKVEMRNPENDKEKLPIPLSGRIDAINRTASRLVDFKTSKSKYDEVETRKKIQGLCYIYGYLMKTGKLIKEMDYLVLRKDMKSEDRIEVVELKYDEADISALYFRIKNILLRIANREFDKPLVGHAPYCQCKKYEEALSVK
jgi:hypothetical protein